MRWRFSSLIISRDRREPIIRLNKVHYFTRGSKVSLRNIGPETAKISRNIHPNKARVSPSLGRIKCNSPFKFTNRHCRTMIGQRASVNRRYPARPYMYTVCLQLLYKQCVVIHIHSIPRCVRYSDKLPMKIPCNCWNNSLWNHISAKPGEQMSLEFQRIVSLQIQVTTKDFKSWIHYWTIPLKTPTLISWQFCPKNQQLVLCFHASVL